MTTIPQISWICEKKDLVTCSCAQRYLLWSKVGVIDGTSTKISGVATAFSENRTPFFVSAICPFLSVVVVARKQRGVKTPWEVQVENSEKEKKVHRYRNSVSLPPIVEG